jgi:hypothetical protein
MPNAPAFPRLARLAGAVLVGALAASCGSGGGEGTHLPENPADLKLIYFTANRREAWERNAKLEFHFSAPLSMASLKLLNSNPSRCIEVGIVTSGGRIPAKGSFSFRKAKPTENGPHIDKNLNDRTVIEFDPTRTSANASVGCQSGDNPFGFQPLTTYDVLIHTPETAKKWLTSTVGKPIVEGFDSFFTTGDEYIRESLQPRFVGTDGQGTLGFNPPRKINGEVPYNSSIQIVFNEPMDPTSFELGTTISVKNETNSALQGREILVPGVFSVDRCGVVWTFTPAFSYGGAGYDIAVILNSGLKDLAGNPLANPQTIRFRTEVKPGIPTTQELAENFDNQNQLDVPASSADWGVTVAGQLQGAAVVTSLVPVQIQVAQYPGGLRSRVRDHPFAQGGSAGVGHDQWIYFQSDLGAAAAITQVDWGPSSNALFASNHGRVIVILGHTQGSSLGTSMANNFDVGTPVKVADAAYNIPQRANIGQSQEPPTFDGTDATANGFWPFPLFSNFFEYNGKNNLLLDVDASLGTNYQITRIFFGPVGFPNVHTFGATGTGTGILVEPAVTDMRFTKKLRTTVAQSKFYNSGVNVPDYSTPVLIPSTQAGGTQLLMEYEGAKGILFPIPGNPNNVIPDPTTFTGYVTNVDQLDGYRFIRFRATCIANVGTGQVPVLKSVSVPYIF